MTSVSGGKLTKAQADWLALLLLKRIWGTDKAEAVSEEMLSHCLNLSQEIRDELNVSLGRFLQTCRTDLSRDAHAALKDLRDRIRIEPKAGPGEIIPCITDAGRAALKGAG